MYILTKGQRLDVHMYLLTNQFDYSGLLVELYNLSQNDQWFLVKLNI